MASKFDRKAPEQSRLDETGDDLSYFPLNMLKDRKTEMYVKFAKVMVIRQGPYASCDFADLTSKFKYASRVLSDKSFHSQTKNDFSVEKAEDYYNYFLSESSRALEEGNNLLVINSSISNLKQNAAYIALAQKMQYVVVVVPPFVNFKSDKQVPGNTMAMAFLKERNTNLQSPNWFQHLFCGWFLHDVDSHELRHEASLYAQDVMEEFPEFFQIVKRNSCVKKAVDIFKDYYNLSDKRQDIAYCAVKVFADLLRSPPEYFKNPKVRDSYGKMSKLYIVGFIISPDMIAARVKLTANQRNVWDMVEELEEVESPDHATLPPCPSKMQEDLKSSLSHVKVNLISSKSNRTIITGDVCHDPESTITPNAKGRSCHIVLGKRSGAKPHHVNYGVQFALRRERDFNKLEEEEPEVRDLKKCVVKKMRKYWFIYLKETIIVEGFFSSFVKPYPFENTIS